MLFLVECTVREVVSIMESQRNLMNNEHYGREKLSPTLYQTYLWAVAHAPTTLLSGRLREGLKAWIIASSCLSLEACEAVLIEARSDSPDLRVAKCRQRIQVINDALVQAEICLVALSEDEQDEIEQFELRQRLLALRRDMLTEIEVIVALHDFGESGYLEAQSEIERLLMSRSPELRSRALEVLVFCWRLPEHKETVWRFLHDPSPELRWEAITYLAMFYEDTPDRRILATLAHVVMSPREQNHIRLYAYEMFSALSGYRVEEDSIQTIREILRRGGTLEQATWLPWRLLKSFSVSCPEEIIRYEEK